MGDTTYPPIWGNDLGRFLAPYLPGEGRGGEEEEEGRPWVTLTWAQSLDARISARPGEQTVISGPETKAMTHGLRSKHDGILVGVGTALADDPKLNCRVDGDTHRIRPVVVDPGFKWDVEQSTVLRLAGRGQALAPWVVIASDATVDRARLQALEADGGKVIRVGGGGGGGPGRLDWAAIFQQLVRHGLRSVMVEGGAAVINQLLAESTTRRLVDVAVVTIGATFLGDQGVAVAPSVPVSFDNAAWHSAGGTGAAAAARPSDGVMACRVAPQSG